MLLKRGRAFDYEGLHARAREDFQRCLALFRGLCDPRGVGAALCRLGQLAPSLNEARPLLDEALHSYASAGDGRGQADALWYRGQLWDRGADPAGCAADLEAALAFYTAFTSTDGRAQVILERGGLREHLGVDLDGAEADYLESARLFDTVGDERALHARARCEALVARRG